MKRVLLILLCCCLIAPSLQAEKVQREHAQPKATGKPAARRVTEEVRQLKQEIAAAKANGQDLTNLLTQLRELRGPSGTRSDRTRGLDDGGETCDDATVIGSLPYYDEGTLSGYSNDLPQQCGGGAGVEVFYRFTAPSDMTISMSTCGMDDFDTVLEIWENCPGDGATYIDCNDDYCDYQSCISDIYLTQGSTYYIIVSGFDESEIGDYVLNIDLGNLCPSPCGFGIVEGGYGCASAVYLPVPSQISSNNNTGENNYFYPDCGPSEIVQPQWYSVIGDGSRFTAETCGCEYIDAVIVVLCGDCCGYTCLDGGDDECGDSQARVTWCTVPGQQYFIVVGGYGSNDYGDFSLAVSSGEPCEAEACYDPSNCACAPGHSGQGVYCQRGDCTPIWDYGTSEVYIEVTEPYLITDLNICVSIFHSFISDLQLWLVSPEGTGVMLFDMQCNSENNFPCILFDDEASGTVEDNECDLEENASIIPFSELSAFDGENAEGIWILYVRDNYGEDEGGVSGACLYIDYDEILSAELVSFSALPGDGEVVLNWQTASETNQDRFDILRDNAKVAEVDAANSPSGASYHWTDVNVTNGRSYEYTLVGVELDGTQEILGTISATPDFSSGTVAEFALYQNYPNPFNPTTNIAFDLVDAGIVKLSLFNMLGQNVAEIAGGTYAAGRHVIEFDASGLSSGVYIYRLETGEFKAQKKLLLMK